MAVPLPGGQQWTSGRRQPIRVALGIFLFCVGISYVLAMSGPMSPDERSPADVAILALASWSGTLLLTHDGIYERRRLNALVWRFAVCGGADRRARSDPGRHPSALGGPALDSRTLQRAGVRPGHDAAASPGRPAPSIHPIEYGVVLAMILPLALHVGFYPHPPPACDPLAARPGAGRHHPSDLVAIGLSRAR